MSASLSAFIDRMKKAEKCELASQYVDQLLATKSTDEMVEMLVEIAESGRINDETLGYYVFPGLQRMLKKDKSILNEIAKLIKQPELPETFIMHCILLLADYYRKTYGAIPPPDFVQFIRDVATDPQIEVPVRARVARLFTRLPEKGPEDILETLIGSGEAQLIEAACHTIARWSMIDLAEHRELIGKLMAYARRSPQQVLTHPQLLRTVVRIDRRSADAVIEKVLTSMRSKEDSDRAKHDIVRLAACLAPGLSPEKLSGIVGVAKTMGPEGRLAIRHLVRNEPAVLDLLYSSGHYQELLAVIEAEPTSFGKAAIDYLEQTKVLGGKTSEAAERIEHDITSARYNAFLPSEHLRVRKSRSRAVWSTQPQSARRYGTHLPPIHAEYSTGLNMGDAMYRDTYLIDPFCHNHWHAGLFQAFEIFPTDSGITSLMRGVHMTGFPGDVDQFEASSADFASPQCEVVVAMKALYDEFMEAFMVDPDHPLRGIRRTPTMSKADRLNLLQKSENLTYRSIYYTFADMLDWHGTHWSGAIEDIDNLRCDGVVEYTYEACGKKVCAGRHAAHWNIASPGNHHPESHADLHTFDLNDGELCPKVQAGAEGNDTTLIPALPSAPRVMEFTIHEETRPTGDVVVIKFKVSSDDYYSVYVRILVGEEGGPLDFATTVPIEGYGIAGKWMFKEVDEGVNHFVYWRKDTQPFNPSGNTANLEVRFVAVDKGGNVSAEYVSRLPLN